MISDLIIERYYAHGVKTPGGYRLVCDLCAFIVGPPYPSMAEAIRRRTSDGFSRCTVGSERSLEYRCYECRTTIAYMEEMTRG